MMTDIGELYRAIAKACHEHQARTMRPPAGKIYIGLADARAAWSETGRRGEFSPAPPLDLKHGSTGTLLGMPFEVDEDLMPGQVFIGVRVSIPAKPAPAQAPVAPSIDAEAFQRAVRAVEGLADAMRQLMRR